MENTLNLKGKVEVRVLSYLAEVLGFENKTFEVNEPTRIIDLIPELEKFRERLVVLVNGKAKSLEARVSCGDEVVISPVFGGG